MLEFDGARIAKSSASSINSRATGRSGWNIRIERRCLMVSSRSYIRAPHVRLRAIRVACLSIAGAITANMSLSLQTLASIVGSNHLITDSDVLAGRSVDHTGRYRGKASALVRPGSPEQVAEVLRVCRDAGAHVTVQGGRTSLVAGTVPEHDDVLLSTERLRALGDVDTLERRVEVGAGATLAAVQHAASAAGLVFGVDLAARDTATAGGMASTNAGGLRTVRYGNMGDQVVGLEVALPDGSLLRRHGLVRRDNTGYDLPALFV